MMTNWIFYELNLIHIGPWFPWTSFVLNCLCKTKSFFFSKAHAKETQALCYVQINCICQSHIWHLNGFKGKRRGVLYSSMINQCSVGVLSGNKFWDNLFLCVRKLVIVDCANVSFAFSVPLPLVGWELPGVTMLNNTTVTYIKHLS